MEGVERIRDFMQSTSGGFDSLASAAEAVRAYNPSRQRPVRSAHGLVKNLRQGADGRFQWHWDPALLDLISLESSGAVQRRCEAAAARITTPTLLLRGAQSDIVSDAGVAELRTLIRGAETSDVQGTGHMVAGDDNAAFTSRVLDFLASLSTLTADGPSVPHPGIRGRARPSVHAPGGRVARPEPAPHESEVADRGFARPAS